MSDRGLELGYEITVRNHKRETVNVTVNERIFGDWFIIDENINGEKLDASTQQYNFDVKRKGSRTFSYTARITY